MRRIIISIAVILTASVAALAQSPADTKAFNSADWHWTKTNKAMQAGWAEIEFNGHTQFISVVKYNPKKYRTDVIYAPAETIGTTSGIAKRYPAVAAINAGYFNMKTLYGATYTRVDGKDVCENDPTELWRLTGFVAMNGTKVAIDTTVNAIPSAYEDAITCGPILLKDGEMIPWTKGTPGYNRDNPRSFIGYDKKGTIYMVVIDGRFEKGFGTTIPETQQIAKLFGLTDALNLDGGGSSAVWTDKTGTINHPCDNGQFDHEGEREIPSIIIVSKK